MTERNRRLMAFMQQHGGAAVQYAYGLSRNRQDAHDLVQDALCRVLSNWQGGHTEKSIKPWFFSILKNCFVDSYRKRKKNCAFVSESHEQNGHVLHWGRDTVQDTGAFLEEMIRKETAGMIRGALNGLRPKHRMTLILYDVEGDTYCGVAEKLRLPVGTVKSRLHRARTKLRQRFAAMEALQ